jgi:DNA polymerase III subunit beta
MKFSVHSSELQKTLGNIGGVIPTKSTLPILENFLFELSDNALQITATDLEIHMSVSIKVKGLKDGKIAIPAKRLFETIRALPATEVVFDIDVSNNKIVMTTDNGEYKLTGESSENYPSIPQFKGYEELKLNSDTLKRHISKTTFAVSTDELRPSMMGILFQLQKKQMCSVATDGHRLVRVTNLEFKTDKLIKDIIIPSKALNLILKSIDDSETTISLNDTHLMFTFKNTILVTRIIEEKYPNYESVIPLDNEKKLIINKNQLLASVRRTSLYASTTTHQVRFSLKKGSLIVSAEDIDFGSEANENIICDYSSEPMEIGFNSAYMIDVLSHIDTEEAVFLLNTPTRACVVTPVAQKEGENLLMLVMPVRLNT